MSCDLSTHLISRTLEQEWPVVPCGMCHPWRLRKPTAVGEVQRGERHGAVRGRGLGSGFHCNPFLCPKAEAQRGVHALRGLGLLWWMDAQRNVS